MALLYFLPTLWGLFFGGQDIIFVFSKRGQLLLDDVFFISLRAHGLSTLFVLSVGPVLLFPGLQRSRPGLHGKMGRLYLASILFLAIPSAIGLSFYAFGQISKYYFRGLALVWLVAAVQTFLTARRRRLRDHRPWAIATFCIGLTAPLQRFIILQLPGWETMGFDVKYDISNIASLLLAGGMFLVLKKSPSRV